MEANNLGLINPDSMSMVSFVWLLDVIATIGADG